MTTAATLTDAVAHAMLIAGTAVRVSDTLVTRTAHYQWDDVSERYTLRQGGLRVQHVSSGDLGKGYSWSKYEKRFYACACPKCL